MATEFDITPELRHRIDAVAARSGLTPSEVIADALENGHSLAWQEQFLDKVADGTAAANRGDFASDGDIRRVLDKYRPT